MFSYLIIWFYVIKNTYTTFEANRKHRKTLLNVEKQTQHNTQKHTTDKPNTRQNTKQHPTRQTTQHKTKPNKTKQNPTKPNKTQNKTQNNTQENKQHKNKHTQKHFIISSRFREQFNHKSKEVKAAHQQNHSYRKTT